MPFWKYLKFVESYSRIYHASFEIFEVCRDLLEDLPCQCYSIRSLSRVIQGLSMPVLKYSKFVMQYSKFVETYSSIYHACFEVFEVCRELFEGLPCQL